MTTTASLVSDMLDYAHPLWVTVEDIANELDEYRSYQSIRDALKVAHERGQVERQISDRTRAPYEWRRT